ncbi:biosynthetic-type acetolactate synthase large subunit [Desulfurobacterium atlanticum]|uniref:Acetolactate synthase n=1 Tax=Desulfurobacterium atlanticum TaxID=240169 RepID=A0A238Y6E3_9BACT|nr:biosynthetic-type acetolactate synthase large subunit [Desulfurobacterium atlanticum]SNR66785.1 acetolactate synthase, large subunit [Desulfurobacterium atlanticum]
MKLSGAEILLEALKLEGVEYIFGYPGGAVLDIYDRLTYTPLKHILTRHEQGAAHAADGYARTTGKVGVCFATSGPGATNLVTGIATAQIDSVPIVAFTGNVPTFMIGNDAFQEVDTVGITRPITKHNFLVKDVNNLADTIKKAFYIAKTGRPGVVLVDLPKDVMRSIADFFEQEYRSPVQIRSYKPVKKGHPGQIKRAAKAIAQAKRPVLYVGGGIIKADASDLIVKLAELVTIPVTTTLMGLGAIPGTHPYFLGMLGMHGTYAANMAVTECDLLIAVGARFDDRVTGKVAEFAPNAKIIHIDVDSAEIGKVKDAHIPIVGDAKLVLEELLPEVEKQIMKNREVSLERDRWMDLVQHWKVRYPLYYEPSDVVIKPQFVIEKIYEITDGDAIISTDVGQHQMWTAQYYKFKRPKQLATSGGLGTMGYGVPAAIGAQIGNPDKTVFCISGDGSFQMNMQEIVTAANYKIPVKIAILNNRYLGMVRQWQGIFYDRNYSEVDIAFQPDFVKLTESMGGIGLRAEKPEDVEKVLKEAMAINDRPVVIDFVVNREEDVFPMVPPGAAVSEMILPDYGKKKSRKAVS